MTQIRQGENADKNRFISIPFKKNVFNPRHPRSIGKESAKIKKINIGFI